MHFSKQLPGQLQEVFRAEFPDLSAWAIDSKEYKNGKEEADWVIVCAACSEQEWDSLPNGTKILSPYLPCEFEALNHGIRLSAETTQRWFWLPPVSTPPTKDKHSQHTSLSYSITDTHKGNLAYARVAEAGGFLDESSSQLNSENDPPRFHSQVLTSQKGKQLALSNADFCGSPLRYFATGCHYPSISVENKFNLKTAFNQFHFENLDFECDLDLQPIFHPPGDLTSLVRGIVQFSDLQSEINKAQLKPWQLLALPVLRNLAPPTAAVEALNLQRNARKPNAQNTPRNGTLTSWMNNGDQPLQLFSYLSQLKDLDLGSELFSANLIKNLSVWLCSTPYSRPWKIYFSVIEKLIPDFHIRFLKVQAELPANLLSQIRLPKDSGPATSRVAAALSESYPEKFQTPEDPIIHRIKGLHLKELSNSAAHLRSLVESITFWAKTASLEECKEHIESLYKKDSRQEDLRLFLVRSLSNTLPLQEALNLVQTELEQQKATSFTLKSVVSWWCDAGRINEAIEIINLIYKNRQNTNGLLSLVASNVLDPLQWDLYSRRQSTDISQKVPEAESLLANDRDRERSDTLSRQLEIRLALYKGEIETASEVAKNTRSGEQDPNEFTKEFWFFGLVEIARELLAGKAFAPINKAPHERLTSVLINLSLGFKEQAESELKTIFKNHSSIALSSASLHPTNQYLLLHTLDTWNGREKAAQFWLERSSQQDSQHERVLDVLHKNIFPMAPSHFFQNPFSSLVHSS